jgi:hypothetical protein
MQNEQLQGQQLTSMWESRVASAEVAVKVAERKADAVAAKKDKERSRLEAKLKVCPTILV